MTKVWWKAVFNGIGFLRRRRTPRGDFVGEGKGLSKLWSRFNGDEGKSSPANLSTIRSAVLKAPDNLFLAVPISAGKCQNCNLFYNLKSIVLRLLSIPGEFSSPEDSILILSDSIKLVKLENEVDFRIFTDFFDADLFVNKSVQRPLCSIFQKDGGRCLRNFAWRITQPFSS